MCEQLHQIKMLIFELVKTLTFMKYNQYSISFTTFKLIKSICGNTLFKCQYIPSRILYFIIRHTLIVPANTFAYISNILKFNLFCIIFTLFAFTSYIYHFTSYIYDTITCKILIYFIFSTIIYFVMSVSTIFLLILKMGLLLPRITFHIETFKFSKP